MGIVRLWPAILAVFIPGIVLLYLLKQKVNNQKISALNLWKEAFENIQASTPWEKFRNNILMYMQIAALVLLIIALMSPYIKGKGKGYANVLILIDNSASMSGMYTEDETKLETAKEQAADYVNSDDGARFTVLSASATAGLEISGSGDKKRVIDAIENIEATDTAGSLEPGISMVQSFIAAWDSYRVIAFTDSSANVQDIDCEVIDLSVEGNNGALQSLSHTVSIDGAVKVMARVDNYGKDSLSTDVNLYIGKKLYDIQNVTVKPGESGAVYFKDIPKGKYNSIIAGNTPYLMAEINSRDMLAGDNTVYDILNSENDEKILLVTEQNTFLEKALKLMGNHTVEKVPPEDSEVADTDEYSLVVYDSILPGSLPGKGNVIFINPPVTGPGSSLKDWQKEVFKLSGEEGDTKKDNKDKATDINVVKSSVTEYLEDYSFTCLDVTEFKLPSWASGFFSAGGNTAGYIGNYQGRTAAVIGFDLHNTDFPLQTEFPIFMYNLLKETMSTGITEKTVYNAGEAAVIQKKGDAGEAVVTKPDGTKETLGLKDGTAIFGGTSRAGLYSVKEGDGTVYFTVSFPEDESDVSEEAVITSGKNVKTEVKDKVGGNVSRKMVVMPVLALLLILLMAEWHVYRKRL